MKKFKTGIIILVLACLAAAAYYLSNQQVGASMAEEALSEFGIKDTASIDKLVITGTDGSAGVVLLKKNGEWVSDKNECVQQHLVETLLHTIRYIRVKGPVSAGAISNITKSLLAHHKKMEIYQNGELTKTWYVGNPTQDQYGTFMLLKDPEKGMSPEPYIMFLPTMHGSLTPRFISDPLQFECTGVFNYDPLNIGEVSVSFAADTMINYRIKALDKNRFELYADDEKVSAFDTAQVRNYLLNYQKIHFEQHNYILNEAEVDSLKNSTPEQVITVKTKAGEAKTIKLYKRKYDYEKFGLDGELLTWDQDRAWVVLDDGTLVAGQYFVFDVLTVPFNYFEIKE
jgi:hypothetical protein